MEPLVHFASVSKVYSRRDRRVALLSLVPGRIGEGIPERDSIHALQDVSFDLNPGGSLAIVGPNGAGKSTVLKLVAGITGATSGSVRTRGRNAALLELGVGFHPDLTGRENLRFYATMLGITRSELRERQDEILEFSGLRDFLDVPVKKYSSGMLARLGFSIGSHVPVDLLIVDEALAVGDADFQARCHERLAELTGSGVAVMFVTHQLWTIPMVCEDAIVLREGRVVDAGRASDVVARYQGAGFRPHRAASRLLKLAGPQLDDSPEHLQVTFQLECGRRFPNGQVLILLRTQSERVLASATAGFADLGLVGEAQYSIRARIAVPPRLMPGHYSVLLAVKPDQTALTVADYAVLHWEVSGERQNTALLGDLTLGQEWEAAPFHGADAARGSGDPSDEGLPP